MIEKVCTKCGAKWLFGNDNHNECPECDGELRKKNNADRIRAMTDEELAEWFFTSMYDMGIQCNPCRGAFDCKYCLLEWLKQEAET